ncbi:MAG TPA: solute carrier family 23 protein, partial [Candidatus Binataceae bacterium]|nr:solute carrier family 23 protein [Candidatus Binataceae bacterium]
MTAALNGETALASGDELQRQRRGNPIRRFWRRAYTAPILPASAKKPSSLIYSADDRPSSVVALSNGVQHVGLISINLVYPLLICRAVDAPISLVADLLSIGMIVLSIGTLMQVLRLGPVGSGYMLPSTFTASYFAPGLIAARLGGLPLVFGMTIFAGALEAFVAPMLNRLRKFLPVEVSGLVIFMLGIAAGLAGLRTLLGPTATPVSSAEWLVAATTLGTMTALNIWGRGLVRMLCALIGLILGYAVAATAGLMNPALWALVSQADWVGIPHFAHVSYSFNATLVAPFAIASLAAAMKAAGTLAICEKMNDANWVRPNMRSVTRGVLSDGLATMIAGFAGTAGGVNTSTPSAGLASATGVASRSIAVVAAAIFLLLGFCPKLTALLAIMPRAVVVSALMYAVTFIMINGLQVMMSRMLDARRTFVLGFGILGGLAMEVFPKSVNLMPSEIAAVAGSSLVASTAIALILNFVFRLGVRKAATLSFPREQIDPQR